MAMRWKAALVVLAVAACSVVSAETMLVSKVAELGWGNAWGEPVETLPYGSGTLPSSYSLLPDYVTPVKNQGPLGTCWAFATYGSMESNILVSGGAETDLSENHLAHNHAWDYTLSQGGHIWVSTGYLGHLSGPVLEMHDVYDITVPYESNSSAPRTDLFLHDMVYFDMTSEIKQGVMDSGGVYTSMYIDMDYYDDATDTYLYTGGASTNHGVTIVGWDNDKAVSGTSSLGAWQCKNSYGTGWGDNGYFWISYEDTKAASYGASFQATVTDQVVGVYDHDDIGRVGELNTPWALNVFTTSEAGYLGAVGFYTPVDGASYDVRVYDQFGGSPSGLLWSDTGTIAYQGFHVIDLDNWLTLGASEDFVVYLYLTDAGGYPQTGEWYVYAPNPQSLENYTSNATASPGESYYSFNGSSWTDLYYGFDTTANFAIKAYMMTPEPGTAIFALIAVGAAAWVRRRKKKDTIH